MKLVDFIVIAVILGIVTIAAWCIYKSKKSGKKCIGCPDSCACSNRNCGSGCSGCSEKN